GHEVVVFEAETWHAIDRVGNKFGAGRPCNHRDAGRIGLVPKFAFENGTAFRVDFLRATSRRGRTLSSAIVRRGTDAAKTENDVATGHGFGQCPGEKRGV